MLLVVRRLREIVREKEEKRALEENRKDRYQSLADSFTAMQHEWKTALLQLDTADCTLALLHQQMAFLKDFYHQNIQRCEASAHEWVSSEFDYCTAMDLPSSELKVLVGRRHIVR